MKALDKLKGFLNPDSVDDEYVDDYGFAEEEEQNYGYSDSYQNSSFEHGNTQGAGMSINSSALELKVIRPDRFESVSQIADHLLNKRTVVLNLEATNKETSRRIIDFLSGVAYSISGNLKRVANNTFVITPCNVDVSNDNNQDANVQQQPASGVAKQSTSDIYGDL